MVGFDNLFFLLVLGQICSFVSPDTENTSSGFG